MSKEYINRELLENALEDENKNGNFVFTANWIMEIVDNLPNADVVPKSEVAREIFEEIYKTMNSVYASVQHSCVGMHGDNPETMRLIGKLEGVKHLGGEIAELKKKYTA